MTGSEPRTWSGLDAVDLLQRASFVAESEASSASARAERAQRAGVLVSIVLSVLITAGVGAVAVLRPVAADWRSNAALGALVVLALVQEVAVVLWIRNLRARTRDARIRAAEEREARQKQLEHLERITPLGTLINVNDELIRKYHNIATFQADRSFKSSQWAMWAGMAIIVGCAAGGMYAGTGDTKAFVAVLGASGAGLSGFLSRTYLAMYRDALEQMNRYFEQPVLKEYYLTAERLVRDLEDSPEGEMKRLIAERVLAVSDRIMQPDRRPRRPAAAGDEVNAAEDPAAG